MITIQKYLKDGNPINDLTNEDKLNLIFKADYTNNLIIFNYRQIGSKFDDISLEARGIILTIDNFDVVHYPFKRFFNDREKPNFCGIDPKFKNRKNLTILEKLDGSLFGIFYHNSKWDITTRGVIGAYCPVAFGNTDTEFTFEEYFNEIVNRDELFSKLNPNLDYTFEIVGPKNRIITPYEKEKEGLYLICLRQKPEFKELPYDDIVVEANRIGTKYPKKIDDPTILVKEVLIMDDLDEGFVCVDYTNHYDGLNYPRIKIKNLTYIIKSKEKKTSIYDIFGLILLGKDKQYIEKFNTDNSLNLLFLELHQKYLKLITEIYNYFDICKDTYPDDECYGKSRIKKPYNDFIFKLYKNIHPFAYISDMINRYGLKHTAKKLIRLFEKMVIV